MHTRHILRIIVALCLTLPALAGVTNITHAGFHLTIVDAVTNAISGDTLLVTTGVYAETVNIYDTALTIDGKYRMDFSAKADVGATIIDAPWPDMFSSPGSVIDITNAAVQLTDLELTDGGFGFITMLGYGGGLDIRNGSAVTATTCSIHHNVAKGFGGGIYVENSSLSLDYTSILHNGAFTWGTNGMGGGVFAKDSRVDFNGTEDISYNYAQDSGGGAAISGGAFILANNADMLGNVAAQRGGGVLLINHATGMVLDAFTYIGYSSMGENNAVTNGDGGGIYAADSLLILSNHCVVAVNTAAHDGGGVYLTNSTLICAKATIGLDDAGRTNVAGYNGGGVYALNSQVIMRDGAVLCNGYAAIDGGGLYAYDSAVNLAATTISGNECGRYGAGCSLWNATVFAATNVLFINNKAAYGGGVYANSSATLVADLDAVVISNNTATGNGGGIRWVVGSGQLTVRNNSRIYYNHADGSGGGVAINHGNVGMDKTRVLYNTATYNGGGIYINGDGALTSTDHEILFNSAGRNGGAVACNDAAAVVLRGVTMSAKCNHNHARRGGSVFAETTTNVTLESTDYGLHEVLGNTALEGGGLFLGNGAAVSARGFNLIANNTAENNGGGVFVNTNAQFTGEHTLLVYGNIATNSGGGMMVYGSNATAHIDGAVFGISYFGDPEGNQALGTLAFQGGGALMASDHAHVNVLNCRVENNSALMYAGGVFIAHQATARIVSDAAPASGVLPLTVFSNNYASHYAGGLLMFDSPDCQIENAAFIGNRAGIGGGALVAYNATGMVINTIMAYNQAASHRGDACFLQSSLPLTFQQCTLAYNDRTNMFVDNPSAPPLLENCIVWGHTGEQLPSNAVANYCDVEGGFPGTLNLNTNPVFMNAADLDFALDGSSPCRDQGMALSAVTNDCIFNPRPYDAGWDMGAYEFVPEPLGGAGLLLLLLLRRAKRPA